MTTENLFGVAIDDPFRWLEGDPVADPRVRAWAEAQARAAEDCFRALPDRERFRRRLEAVWDFEKVGLPVRRGQRIFREWNPGLDNHSAVLVQEGLDGPPRGLIDPNAMDPGGGCVVRDWWPSPDGRLVAYTLQVNGGDWRTLRFVDVDSGSTLPDVLTGLKAAQVDWQHDGRGVFYTAFEGADEADGGTAAAGTITWRSTVRMHRLGEPVANDAVVLPPEDDPAAPVLLHFPRVSDCGRWLLLSSSSAGGQQQSLRVRDLSLADAPLRPLVPSLAHRWLFVGGSGDALYFITDWRAPRGCVARLDPTAGPEQVPTVVVPEGERPLHAAVLAGSEFVLQYGGVATSSLQRFTRSGAALAPVVLPDGAVVDGMRGTPDAAELWFRLSSMVQVPTVHRLDLGSGHAAPWRAPRAGWDAQDFVIRRIVGTSADGTQVPVTLAHARALDVATPRPTLLLVYGGFGLSPEMAFMESRFAWIAEGGVFAVAHTRGGGEFGADWAAAGRKGGRLRVVDDYLAAAQAVVTHGIASPRTLVAVGASNGGLIVAAATNARPDAFAATLCRVPVTDMLRYTRFTLGRMWIDELGSPDVEAEFHALRAYSPLHNVRGGRRYPPMVVTTAEADDRVVPAHAFKYVATLQQADIGPGPHLLRIERGAGHGEGKPARKLIDEFADLYAFAAAQVRP